MLELSSGQLTNKELVDRTGFAKSTISEHVHELMAANLVRLTLSEEGNFKAEFQNFEQIQLIITKIRQADQKKDMVENFANLWDF